MRGGAGADVGTSVRPTVFRESTCGATSDSGLPAIEGAAVGLEGVATGVPGTALAAALLGAAEAESAKGERRSLSSRSYNRGGSWLAGLSAAGLDGCPLPVSAAGAGVGRAVSVAAFSFHWKEKLSPEAILTARGCRTGADVTVRDRYHWSTIFPVWCGE